MTIGTISSLQGIQRAEGQFNEAANNIAQWGLSPTPQGDSVDLSTQVLALLQANNSFAANIAALKVDDEMTQSLLKSIG